MSFAYEHVGIAAVDYEAPPEVVTSGELETRLAPLYERIGLVPGRLEMMTGIRERRFWPTPQRPSAIATLAARKALKASRIEPERIGVLAFCGVSRDQMEPASAHAVHHALGLASDAHVFDLSNACLGVLNGMVVVANMIELGQVEAGIVVAGEDGRRLVDGTVERLRQDEDATRRSVKSDFASLTVGAGAAAVVLARTEVRPQAPVFEGGTVVGASRHHDLCVGGSVGASELSMATDAEALLEAGLEVAREAYAAFRRDVVPDGLDKVVTHQVGRAHHVRLLDELGLDPRTAFTTYESFGNVGSVSVPLSWAMALEQGFVAPGDRLGLLGIGSGLGCLMASIRC